MGVIVLEGGAEFNGKMAEPDLRAMLLAGGSNSRIRIVPAAAAPDQNHQKAGDNGVRWFRKLGARDVATLPLIDRASADDSQIAAQLAQAGLIYLLGGFPGYLEQTLADSVCWRAIQAALHSGSVLAGSSAGAMVLCEMYYDPEAGKVKEGLNLVAAACVLPHHNTFGKDWAPKLVRLMPHIVLIGIDEATGMISDTGTDTWRVYGAGNTTLYRGKDVHRYGVGESFRLNVKGGDTPH